MMRRSTILALSTLMLTVSAASIVASQQPGTPPPPPTVEQLDAAVAVRALTDHFRRNQTGRQDEFKLATLQWLHTIEGLSQEDMIAFGRELSTTDLDAPTPTTRTADSPAIELGLTVNAGFMGPIGARIAVDHKLARLMDDLVPDFVRSPNEPAVAAIARTPLNNGVLDMTALQETYDRWRDRRFGTPLAHELVSQEMTAASDRRLYLESEAYRAARPEFINNVAFKPTDAAPTVLKAVPAFAASETGAKMVAELQALRAELEAHKETDERIAELQRLNEDATERAYALHQQAIGVIKDSLSRDRDRRLPTAEEERLKVLRTDTENAMTVFGVTAGVLLRFAPNEVKAAVKGRGGGPARHRAHRRGSAPLSKRLLRARARRCPTLHSGGT